MGLRTGIRKFVRWVLTWPLLVIVALNLENVASEAGYSNFIVQQWRQTSPMIMELYSWATAPWITYPTVFLSGMMAYEWIGYVAIKMERDGSTYQRWLVRIGADNLTAAFSKAGFTRKTIKPETDLVLMNKRLAAFDLTQLPLDFDRDEDHNRIYASYLALIAKGEFGHAQSFILSQIAILNAHVSEDMVKANAAPATEG